jgi:outer membrane scaffolding protein for murein synthesis (MipA/OmpV family)
LSISGLTFALHCNFPKCLLALSRRQRIAAAVALATAVAWQTAAAENGSLVNGETAARIVVGANLQFAPEYAGADRQELKLRPLWALQYGRVRISTSGASSVLGFGADAPGPGASADLIKKDRFKLSLALRLDHGRRSSDSPDLAGLPDIRQTLRGRLGASYALDAHWTTAASISQDLLGRGGGAVGALDLGYKDRLTDSTHWSAGAGIAFGNARYMQSYFGVADGALRPPGLPSFAPGAGLRDVHTGLGLMTAITPSWVAFGGVGYSTLLGGAASSPLTKSRNSWSASIGMAWRCCY